MIRKRIVDAITEEGEKSNCKVRIAFVAILFCAAVVVENAAGGGSIARHRKRLGGGQNLGANPTPCEMTLGEVRDFYIESPPTQNQIEFNYTRRVCVEGYICVAETGQVMYLEEPMEDSICTEALFWSKQINCDKKNVTRSLCVGEEINTDLANMRLDGTQSCSDASDAINMKYGGVDDHMFWCPIV